MTLFRPVIPQDIRYIADHIREEDRQEVHASGSTVLDALVHGSLCRGVAYTGVGPSGYPACMFGVNKLTNDTGLVWLLGTPEIEQAPVRFLRASRQVLDTLYVETGVTLLHNSTWAGNPLHHKWLRWLGFTFMDIIQIGKETFYTFGRLRGN